VKKVYFAGSIRGGRDDALIYKQIIDFMAQLEGWTVLTEHIGLKNLTSMGENRSAHAIYDRDIAWVREADAIVAEVTSPSLGVGYEIAKAEDMQKPILCLFRPSAERRLSAMIGGSPLLTVIEYGNVTDTEAHIGEFLGRV
jgi:hypothetical protein